MYVIGRRGRLPRTEPVICDRQTSSFAAHRVFYYHSRLALIFGTSIFFFFCHSQLVLFSVIPNLIGNPEFILFRRTNLSNRDFPFQLTGASIFYSIS